MSETKEIFSAKISQELEENFYISRQLVDKEILLLYESFEEELAKHFARKAENEALTCPQTLYSIHFERINLESDYCSKTPSMYFGIGLDLDMQRIPLGFWFKTTSESNFIFWIRVLSELKNRGLQEVQLEYFKNHYWLDEAFRKIFP